MSITSLKNANSDLILSAINIAILLAPYSTTMPETLEDPATGDLIALSGFTSVGLTEKGAGISFGHESTSTDIESHGEAEPTKKILSKRVLTTNFVMQESNRQALELWWGADYSGIVPSAKGGVVLPAPKRPQAVKYRAIAIGEDGMEGAEIYPYWLLPKVVLTGTDNQQVTDTGAITYHPTLTAFKDRNFLGGVSSAQGFCGPGWQALVAAAGFAVSIVKIFTITGSPTGGTFTITVDGQTTTGIAFDAAAAAVQSALEALSSVGAGKVTVTGSAGGPYTATFSKKVTTVTASGTGLTPSGGVTVS